MKKIRIIFLAIIINALISLQVRAQFFQSFGNIVAENDTVLSFILTNNESVPWNVDGINVTGNHVRVISAPSVIYPRQSGEFLVSIHIDQNVEYYDMVTIRTDKKDLVVVLSWQGIFNDYCDAISKNLWDENLKQSLKNYLQNHTVLSYNTARDSMFTIVDNINDSIECVYTGRKIFLDHTSSTPRSDAYNQNVNTEHTFPQGLFNKELPMKSDLFHLFPSDVTANSKRGSYPFGNVVSNIQYESGGSKLGMDNNGNTVFEPRTVHKGNVARAMFYFVTCYQNYSNFLDSQESILREWNKLDSVDEREKQRNNHIARIQGRRNPFIDHLQLVDRIINFSHTQNRSWSPELVPNADTLWVTDQDTMTVFLFNHGRGLLNISAIESADTSVRLIVGNLPRSINYGELDSFKVIIGEYWQGPECILSISSNDPNDPTYSIVIKQRPNYLEKKEYTDPIHVQVFPNPFNAIFTVQPSSDQEIKVISIYNILGKVIYSREFDGFLSVNGLRIDLSGHPTGIYFLKIQTNEGIYSKKLIYLR